MNNPQLSYGNLFMFNLGAVHHLGWKQKWIFTIQWPPGNKSASAYQISTKSDSVYLELLTIQQIFAICFSDVNIQMPLLRV